MKKYEIKWFGDFSCLCDACPQTCCRGWVIPLSDRDCERFRKEKGRLGIELFFATGGWIRAKFNKNSGTCPFLGRDGLCRMQKKKGHDFIPWTCQSYPRFYRNYGSFEECCLDLSCVGAAELFVKNSGAVEVTKSEGEPVTRPCTTNDDEEFLAFLLNNRKEMMDTVKNGISGRSADILFLYAISCQDHFTGGGSAKDDLPSFARFYSRKIEEDGKRSFAFPLPAKVLSQMLGSSLCHPRLRIVDPKLFGMFSKAKRLISVYKTDERKWEEAVAGYCDRNRDISSLFGPYLAYYLYQYYLRTYETYSFRRQTALGLCHLSMVLLLMMAEEKGDDPVPKTFPEVMAAYNRRAYFNDDIQDEMYRIFEDHYARPGLILS